MHLVAEIIFIFLIVYLTGSSSEYQSANVELLWLMKRAWKLMVNKKIEKISLCKVRRFIINPFL